MKKAQCRRATLGQQNGSNGSSSLFELVTLQRLELVARMQVTAELGVVHRRFLDADVRVRQAQQLHPPVQNGGSLHGRLFDSQGLRYLTLTLVSDAAGYDLRTVFHALRPVKQLDGERALQRSAQRFMQAMVGQQVGQLEPETAPQDHVPAVTQSVGVDDDFPRQVAEPFGKFVALKGEIPKSVPAQLLHLVDRRHDHRVGGHPFHLIFVPEQLPPLLFKALQLRADQGAVIAAADELHQVGDFPVHASEFADDPSQVLFARGIPLASRFIHQFQECRLEILQRLDLGEHGRRNPLGRERPVNGDAVPAVVFAGPITHQVVRLAVAAKDEQPAADSAVDALAREAGPLLGYVLPGVDAVGACSAILGIASIGLCDDAVIVGLLEEGERRNPA